MPHLAACLAPLFLLGGCAGTLEPEDALTVVPYVLQPSGRILVDVRIDGRGPYPFALDTAASISFIFDEYRRELALTVLPDQGATIRGVMATGRFPLVHVDRLDVGSEVWSDVRLVSLPGDTDVAAGLAGVLGMDFLRRYGVGFFTADRVVHLYRPERVSDNSYRGWATVPLQPVRVGETSEPLYFFQIEIGGRSLPALFDLGAGLNMINRSGADYLHLVPLGAPQNLVLSDVLENASIVAQLGSEEVATAGIRWRNEKFLIADLQVFVTLMGEDGPLAILGSGLFNQRDFVIDFADSRLLVRAAMEEVDSGL